MQIGCTVLNNSLLGGFHVFLDLLERYNAGQYIGDKGGGYEQKGDELKQKWAKKRAVRPAFFCPYTYCRTSMVRSSLCSVSPTKRATACVIWLMIVCGSGDVACSTS